MKGIIDLVYLIAIVVGVGLVWCIYRAIKLKGLKHKYQTAIKVFKRYGYNYHGYYDYKAKGFIYRKQLDRTTIDSLLLRYKYEPLELSSEIRIYDCIGIIDYPEWQERCYDIVLEHGGLYLFHFYMLEVQIGDKFYQRPFNYYLEYKAERAGKHIIANTQSTSEFFLKNPEIVETMISSDIQFIIRQFNDDEVRYWEHELLKRTKNK